MRTERSIQTGAIGALVIALSLGCAIGAEAQFNQYTAPGSLGQVQQSRKDQIKEAVKNARWHLGAVRLQPWIGIRDLSFVSDLGLGTGQGTDVTATVGAGLKAYLPIGPKATLAAHALPDYVWWLRTKDRRRTMGRYGVGLFGYFNHLTVEATATRNESQGIVTPELQTLISHRSDRASLNLELRVTDLIWLFTRAERSTFNVLLPSNGEPGLTPLGLLDRRETVIRSGVAYRPTTKISIGLGVERSQVEFTNREPGETGADNHGTSPSLDVTGMGNKIQFSLDLVDRRLDPWHGSGFVPFHGLTGTAQVILLPQGEESRLTYSFYGRRSLGYGITSQAATYRQDIFGAALGMELGRGQHPADLRLYVEGGPLTYLGEPLVTGQPQRRDQYRGYGATLGFLVFRNLNFTLGVSRMQYTSNLSGFDRSLTVVHGGLDLTFGSASGGEW